MDTENSKPKDNWKRITCILFALLLVCNAVIFVLSLGMKTQLNEHNKILLTVPPDLQKQISDSFQQTATDLKTKILRTATTTSEAIIAQADKKNSAAFEQMIKSMEEQMLALENDTSAQLAAIKNKIDSIETSSSATAKTLASLQNERETKAALYLKAARASTKTPETAQILYVSALTYSDDKAEILSEFIDWQTKLIRQDVERGNVELAQERLVALAGICDANIALGSVGDMKSIPALKNKLTAAERLITSYQSELIAAQQKQINSFVQRVDSLTSYSEAESLLKDLTALTVDPSLNNQKDALVAKIILKQSYLTTPSDQIIIPVISNDTPWNEWLKNFVVRLKSDLPITKKLEDIGTAAEFLQAAKASNEKGVQDLITEIEKVSRGIYLSYWKERVERVTSSTDSNLNDVSTLITESNAFSAEEQKENKAQIVKLNKYITKATLAEFAEGLKNLKALENSVADETYMQMVGATQGQYIQLLLRLKALDAKYANQFAAEIAEATQKITDLYQLANAYKNKLIVADLEKNEAQRTRFVEWAKKQLEQARKLDREGENIASTWSKTRSSEAAVDKYVAAWKALMSIHPGDLQAVDPALFQMYSELKIQIENHWEPNNYQRKRVTYKRISDF